MAQVVDSLLVTLGLDAKQFTEGQKKAVEQLQKFEQQSDKSNKAAQKGAKELTDNLTKVRIAFSAIGATAIALDGLKNFYVSTAQSNSALGRQAGLLGKNVSELKALGSIAEKYKGSVDSFANGFSNIEGSIAKFKMGQGGGDIFTKLSQLGIKNAISGNVDTGDLAEAIQNLEKNQGTQVALQATLGLGFDAAAFQVLRQGREETTRMVSEMEKVNKLNKDGADKAQAANDAWIDFKKTMEGVGNEVSANVLPGFTNLVKEVTELVHQFSDFDERAGSVPAVLGQIGAAVIGVAASLKILKAILPAAAIPAAAQAATATGVAEAVGVGAAAGGGSTILRTLRSWVLAAELRGFNTSKIFGGLAKGGVGFELLTHTDELNTGESAELAKRWTGQSAGSSSGAPDFAALEKSYGLPSGMLDEIWKLESSRGKNMVSAKGATGHFGFMPSTAASMGMTKSDTYDLGRSANAAAQMLGGLLRKYHGNVDMALAGYNWGSGMVDRYGIGNLPGETRGYLSKYHSDMIGSGTSMSGGGLSGGTSTVNIQNQTINTQATDATGIAKSIGKAMQDNTLINYSTNAMQ